MPDPHVQLMNLAVKAGRLAETTKADRQAEAKMWAAAGVRVPVLRFDSHAARAAKRSKP